MYRYGHELRSLVWLRNVYSCDFSILIFAVLDALANSEAHPFSKSLLKRVIQYLIALPVCHENMLVLEVYCNDFVSKFDDVRFHSLHMLEYVFCCELPYPQGFSSDYFDFSQNFIFYVVLVYLRVAALH